VLYKGIGFDRLPPPAERGTHGLLPPPKSPSDGRRRAILKRLPDAQTRHNPGLSTVNKPFLRPHRSIGKQREGAMDPFFPSSL